MDSKESEYTSLREELIRNSTRIADWTKFAIVTTVALIGYALGKSPKTDDSLAWAIAFLPMAVVFPAIVLSLNHKFQIARIASYIRVQFGETHPYELHLRQMRDVKGFPHPSFEMGSWGTVLVVGIVAVLASVIAVEWRWSVISFVRGVITVACSVSWGYFCRWVYMRNNEMKMGKELEDRLATQWEKIVGSTNPKKTSN